nr:hypothetical protein [Corynebacterium lactis]
MNLLAWRGGEFPPTEADRPLYQQALKDIARFQYENQPTRSVYFGTACGASEDDLLRAVPPLPADDALDEPRPVHGPEFLPPQNSPINGPEQGPGAGERSGQPGANGEDAQLNPRLDAFGAEVDCEGNWDAAFLSFTLAAAGVPLYMPDADHETASENFWLVTGVEQLMQAYRDRGAFFDNPDFSPQVGDIIFYRYPGGLGVHANMIVAVTQDWITVGGDEFGKVGLASMTLRKRGGIVGYGATGYFENAPLPSP